MSEIDIGAKALVLLLAVGALATLCALMVFRKFTDRQAVARSKNLIVAHLLECSLFLDEPRLVFRAQLELIRENMRLLRLLALPIAILILPFWILFAQLEADFGHAPLAVGQPAVLAVRLKSEPQQLSLPAGIALETPAVRNLHRGEINWRVRPLYAASGQLRITLPSGRVLTTGIQAGTGLLFVVVNPFSKPAIDLRYPRANVLRHDWLTWYIAASLVTALFWWARYT